MTQLGPRNTLLPHLPEPDVIAALGEVSVSEREGH